MQDIILRPPFMLIEKPTKRVCFANWNLHEKFKSILQSSGDRAIEQIGTKKVLPIKKENGMNECEVIQYI